MPFASTKAITIYAHRGLWAGRFPENSREAFEFASLRGFRSECDVWLTSDGQPVVMHDETVDRTTSGHGPISVMSSEQVKEIRCRVGEQFFLPPPLLAEVADDVGLVEIKPASAELVRAVVEIMAGRDWMLQSFDAGNIRAAMKIQADLATAFLAEDEAGVRVGIEEGWRVHVDHQLLDDRVVGMLRSAGKPFGVWTVNTEADVQRVLGYGARAIISDYPEMVLRVADREGFDCL